MNDMVTQGELKEAIRSLSLMVEAKAIAHRQTLDLIVQLLAQLAGPEVPESLKQALSEVRDAAMNQAQVGDEFRNMVAEEIDLMVEMLNRG
ncbi:MAG: hypothetical protein ACWA47_10020 [Brevirhabdus sp.]